MKNNLHSKWLLQEDTPEAEMLFEKGIVRRKVSTKVAASLLGITPNALRIRKSRGLIKAVRDGDKELRFYLSDIIRLQNKEA